jgi:alcohol dehydrogenase class IV
MALANAGLGAVHGFAAAIGGMYPIPHGSICAALLPHVFETNLRAATRPELHERFGHIARLLTGRSTAEAMDGLRWIGDLCQKLTIKPLGHFGIQPSAIPDLCDKAARSSSMKANPIALSQSELQSTLAAAL